MIRQAKPEDLECIKAVAKRSKRKMNDEGNPQGMVHILRHFMKMTYITGSYTYMKLVERL